MPPGRTRCTVSAVSLVLMAQMCKSCTSKTPSSASEIVPYLGKFDAARHTVERQIDAVARQAPATGQHHGRDDEADRGIDPQPSREHDHQRSNHHPERNTGIGRHVQIGAADIEVAMAAAHEQQRGAAVDEDAEGGDHHHGPARTAAGCCSRLIASTMMPPTATSKRPALNSAARIEARR